MDSVAWDGIWMENESSVLRWGTSLALVAGNRN